MVKKKAAFVVRITGDSKAAEREIEALRKKLGEMGGTFDQLGGKITDAFSPAAIGAGVLSAAAVVGGLFVKGFLDGVEAERLNDRLAAQLDLSDEQAAAAGGIAAEVYREAWGESIGEVNDALGGLVKYLDADLSDASRNVTRGMLEDALTIADVWDQDVNEVIRSAAALMDSDLADSAEEAFDIITTGLTDGADLNGDFLDTLFEYSTFFGQAGISAEQFLAALIVGTEAGMMGVDKVGDAVKEMSIRIQDGSTASQEALEAIGLDADEVAAAFAEGGTAAQDATGLVLDSLADMEDPLAQTQAAIALLGTPYEDLGELGPEVLEALATGTLEVRDTADVAETAYSNLATELESFKRKGTGALQDFVGAALQALIGGNGSLEDGLVRVNDWIDENKDDIIAWGREFGETAKEVWREMKPLLDVLDDVAEWFADSDNISTIKDWAKSAQFWVGVVKGAIELTIGPLLDVLDIIKDINEQIDAATKGTRGSGSIGKGGGPSGGIPAFHDGGIFTTTNGSSEGLALLRDGEGVFTPGQMAALGSMGGNVNVYVSGDVISEGDLVRKLEAALMRRSLRSGQGLQVRR